MTTDPTPRVGDPARLTSLSQCAEAHPQECFLCAEDRGHDGPHVASGLAHVLAVWGHRPPTDEVARAEAALNAWDNHYPDPDKTMRENLLDAMRASLAAGSEVVEPDEESVADLAALILDTLHSEPSTRDAEMDAVLNVLRRTLVPDAAGRAEIPRPAADRADCGCDLSAGPNAVHIVDDHAAEATTAEDYVRATAAAVGLDPDKAATYLAETTTEPAYVTPRGFTGYAGLTDRNGTRVRVQESSVATEPCVWVFTDGGKDSDDEGSAHLTVEQARTVRDALTTWLGEVSRG